MSTFNKIFTIAALTAPAYTYGMVANDSGIIELDARISDKPKTTNLSGTAKYLMNLRA